MIVEVWQRTMDLAKTGTSGQDTQDEWNGKANSAQKIITTALIRVAEINQEASDALSWLKVPSGPITSTGLGEIVLPSDYLGFDTAEYIANGGRWPVTKLRSNEIALTRTSPIRKPDLTKNEISIYFKSGAMYVMPEQAGLDVDFLYYKQVPDASVILTPASNLDGDLVTPTIGVDFGWPISMFNLLVYTILEQMGIELKEQLLLEYAQFGITRDMIKPNE